MTFSHAVQSLRHGEAVKRESWRGYLVCEVQATEEDQANSRTAPRDLVFVAADGQRSVYSFGTQTKETPMQLTRGMLESFIADDWMRGSADAFEAARTGGGTF